MLFASGLKSEEKEDVSEFVGSVSVDSLALVNPSPSAKKT